MDIAIKSARPIGISVHPSVRIEGIDKGSRIDIERIDIERIDMARIDMGKRACKKTERNGGKEKKEKEKREKEVERWGKMRRYPEQRLSSI